MRSRLLFGMAAAVLAIGCGPTDAGITTAVKARLAADDAARERQIDVGTRNHVVTLTGTVRSTEEETKALQIARATDGVVNVVDQLSVAPEPEVAPTTGIGETAVDPDVAASASAAGITSAVKTKLLADPDVSGLRIDVDTRDRVVTLTGTVRTQAEKSKAIRLAREVDGVRDVTDRLTVQGRQ